MICRTANRVVLRSIQRDDFFRIFMESSIGAANRSASERRQEEGIISHSDGKGDTPSIHYLITSRVTRLTSVNYSRREKLEPDEPLIYRFNEQPRSLGRFSSAILSPLLSPMLHRVVKIKLDVGQDKRIILRLQGEAN